VATTGAPVPAFRKLCEIPVQRGGALGLCGNVRVDCDGRAEVRLVVLAQLTRVGGEVRLDKPFAGHFQRGHAVAEELAHMVLVALHHRRLRSRWRRGYVESEGREEVAHHALGRPVDRADSPAGTANAQELVGHRPVVGGEHYPNRGGHHVELVVIEGEGLGVRLYPLQIQSPCSRFAAAGFQQRGGEDRGDDSRRGLGRGDRHGPRARRHLEHALVRRYPAGGGQLGAEIPDQLSGDLVVIAQRSHGAVIGLARLSLAHPVLLYRT
jgi:hypothetical protein